MLKRTAMMVFCFSLALVFGCSRTIATGREAAPPRLEKKTPEQKSKPLPPLLTGLRREHPRLLFTKADQRRIEKLAETDKFLAEIILQVKNNAERMLTEPVLEFKPDPNFVKQRLILLPQARTCVARVLALAMTYRLTGDRRFFERARQEMLAAAAFKTWNPDHFLDVAELGCAVSIGYDWLYDTLSEKDRATIRNAIVTKALKPGLKGYEGKGAWGWWSKSSNNWNLVCNGGLTLSALAVAEHEPQLAEKIISNALRSVKIGMKSYSPDGAWPEGPGYWIYATGFGGLMIASLDSALGGNFGLADMEGFDKTGLYQIHMVSPSGYAYSFGDSVHGILRDTSSVMYWLGRKFNRPIYSRFKRKLQKKEIQRHVNIHGRHRMRYIGTSRLFPMSVAWYNADEKKNPNKTNSPDALFRGVVDVVTMRSDWSDKAIFVGFKGGDSTAGHAHLDIGNFVLESDGVNWAIDLGKDKYHLPGYFREQRWNYYRCGTKSHNTLVIGGKNQNVKNNTGKVIKFFSTPARAHAVVDMTNAYRGQAEKVLRGLAMLDRSRVLVQDEITRRGNDEIRWAIITPAKIKLDGNKAVLTKDGKTLRVDILSPAGAKFEILSTKPPTKQENQNEGTSMLAFSVKPAGKKNVRLAVLLTPVGKNWKIPPPTKLHPLSEWKNHTKPEECYSITASARTRSIR